MNAWQCVGVTLRRCQGCTWKPGPYFSSPCPALSCSSICKHCSLVFRHRCLPLHAGSQAPSPKGPFPTWIVIFKRNSLDQLGMLGPRFPSLTRPISNPCDISVGPRTPVTGRNTFKRVALESWRWLNTGFRVSGPCAHGLSRCFRGPRTTHRQQDPPPCATPGSLTFTPLVFSLIFLPLLSSLTLSLSPRPWVCLALLFLSSWRYSWLHTAIVWVAFACFIILCWQWIITENHKRKYLLVLKWLELVKSCFGAFRSNLYNCGSQRVIVAHAGISFWAILLSGFC